MTLPYYEYLIFLIALAASLIRCAAVENRYRKLKNKPPPPAPPPPPPGKSIELTEFLSDVKSNGFGFVRVDPGSVFMRSPRD